MSGDETKGIDQIANNIRKDADNLGSKSRFGYFSIPYSAYMGDRYYSQGRSKVYRTEDKRVITEPRGIFTKVMKKGKGPDAFFSNGFKEDKDTLKKVRELAEKEKEEYMKVVKSRKKGGAAEDSDQVFRANFKPTGPQEYKDFYDKNPVKYKVPINQQPNKLSKIDKEHKTVFTERRGILTNPLKHGNSSTPGVLFSYFKEDKKLLERKAKMAEEDKPKRSKSAKSDGEGTFQRPFKPPAIMKCEPFQKDHDIYGEDEKKLKVLVEEAVELRHKGKPKYKKELPSGSVKQIYAFKPPALVKSVKKLKNKFFILFRNITKFELY